MTPSYVRHGATSLAVALLTIPSLIFAQATTGSVRGRVTDAANGRGMAEVQVVVDGTRLGAVTNSNGDYTVNAVPAGNRTLTVRRIGYQPVTRTVNVASGIGATVDVTLRVSAINLNEVVVTGTGSPT